jgi:hypothetical protein
MAYRPDHERYHGHGPSTDPYDVEQREMRGAQPCSRDDDPTQHGRADAAWSRDRDDHDAAVDHFVGRVSPFVARALAGTLRAKVLA